MAQISHLSACLSAALDSNKMTVTLPKQTPWEPGRMLGISGASL